MTKKKRRNRMASLKHPGKDAMVWAAASVDANTPCVLMVEAISLSPVLAVAEVELKLVTSALLEEIIIIRVPFGLYLGRQSTVALVGGMVPNE